MKIVKSGFALAVALMMATTAFADGGQTIGSGGRTDDNGQVVGSGNAVAPSGGYLGSGNITAAAEDCRGQMLGSGGRADCGPLLGSGGITTADDCRSQIFGSGARTECITGNKWADLFLLFLMN